MPDIKIALEYDGTYWHADNRFYKADDVIEHKKVTAKEIWERDLHKTILCQEQGIQLIRVKEYDWLNDKNNIKIKLSNLIKTIQK